MDDKTLEQFKNDFIKGYVDSSLDRLLELRTSVKKATSFDEVRRAMTAEQTWAKRYYGVAKEEVDEKERCSPPEDKTSTVK